MASTGTAKTVAKKVTKKTVKKAVAKKTSPPKKSPPKKAVAPKGSARKSTSARRARGGLEQEVLKVTDAFNDGKVNTEGKPLTPHRISVAIAAKAKLEKGPSAGAITNVLTKWADIGFAKISDKPIAFVGYTAAGLKADGLEACKAKAKGK